MTLQPDPRLLDLHQARSIVKQFLCEELRNASPLSVFSCEGYDEWLEIAALLKEDSRRQLPLMSAEWRTHALKEHPIAVTLLGNLQEVLKAAQGADTDAIQQHYLPAVRLLGDIGWVEIRQRWTYGAPPVMIADVAGRWELLGPFIPLNDPRDSLTRLIPDPDQVILANWLAMGRGPASLRSYFSREETPPSAARMAAPPEATADELNLWQQCEARMESARQKYESEAARQMAEDLPRREERLRQLSKDYCAEIRAARRPLFAAAVEEDQRLQKLRAQLYSTEDFPPTSSSGVREAAKEPPCELALIARRLSSPYDRVFGMVCGAAITWLGHLASRRCQMCPNSIAHRRADSKTCSAKCRRKLSRRHTKKDRSVTLICPA